ncbi:MAG: Gfo/Idh/MocA family oxidoreductase [bacterium]
MKKIRLAIIGCGGMGGAHTYWLKSNPDVQIVGLVDLTTEILRTFADRTLSDYQTAPAMFTDCAAMYREVKPDAVVIATPHTLHFEQGMQALKAGCHVLMEKPMVTSAAHAYKLAAEVKKRKKVFVIGYNTPCTPEFFYTRDVIRKKTLGRLELVSGYLAQGWLKATIGLWRQNPSLSGGGQAYDSGAHILNSLCWSVESDISEVFAFVDNHGSSVDINSSINVRFANGVLASIIISGNCPADGASMHFMFENGRIDIDGWSGSWINVFHGNQKLKYPSIPGGSQPPDVNFIDAIRGRAEPRTTPANGIVQSELMDAIYESARTGKPSRPKR